MYRRGCFCSLLYYSKACILYSFVSFSHYSKYHLFLVSILHTFALHMHILRMSGWQSISLTSRAICGSRSLNVLSCVRSTLTQFNFFSIIHATDEYHLTSVTGEELHGGRAPWCHSRNTQGCATTCPRSTFKTRTNTVPTQIQFLPPSSEEAPESTVRSELRLSTMSLFWIPA